MRQRIKYKEGMILSCFKLVAWSYKKGGTNMWSMVCTLCGASHIHSPAQITQEPRAGCSSCTKGTRTHGKSKSNSTYISWCRMWQRVRGTDPTAKTYTGIQCDPRWLKFENFLEDMGERPPNTTIDRIDVLGNYTKLNCRWADKTTQNKNTRRARMWTIGGVTKHIHDWAHDWKVPNHTVENMWARLKKEST